MTRDISLHVGRMVLVLVAMLAIGLGLNACGAKTDVVINISDANLVKPKINVAPGTKVVWVGAEHLLHRKVYTIVFDDGERVRNAVSNILLFELENGKLIARISAAGGTAALQFKKPGIYRYTVAPLSAPTSGAVVVGNIK